MKYKLNGFYNEDCMSAMKEIPDKYFELAIVDPPYGGGNNENWDKKDRGRFGGRFDKYAMPLGGGYYKN